MNNTTAMPHQGRNVKRIREILGIKQDALAIDLGLSQQAISQLEQRETLDAPMLEKVAKVLGVSEEAIKSFNEEAVINNIQNNYEGSNNTGANVGAQYNFNPLNKIVALYDEKMALYERLLQSEKERVELLEKLLEKK